jgi:hypothetical protein
MNYTIDAMKKKVETLSDANKKLLGNALNNAGIDLTILSNMLEYLDEEKKKELSVLLGELRMNVSSENTDETLKKLTAFFRAN